MIDEDSGFKRCVYISFEVLVLPRSGKKISHSFIFLSSFFFLRSWIPALISPIEEVCDCQEMRLSSVSLITLGVI